MLEKIVQPDRRFQQNAIMWLDEDIWGHRFHDEQTPWLILLEFFALYRHFDIDGIAFQQPKNEGFNYEIPRQDQLRQVVFNNPAIASVLREPGSDVTRWKSWQQRMDDSRLLAEKPFAYLQNNFDKFEDFARLVEFYRETSIERHKNRRWTSKFIFPYGPDSIYADVRLKKGKLENPDRLFFARGGELLYLMFSRSSRTEKLSGLISNKLMDNNDPWNQMIKKLVPETSDHPTTKVSTDVGYLPYLERIEYEEIAKDWIRILELRLPHNASLDPLMRLTGLHILIYILNRSIEEIGQESDIKFILEVAAPKKTAVFELAKNNHNHNRKLTSSAIIARINRFMASETGKIAAESPQNAVEALKTNFAWEYDKWPHSWTGKRAKYVFDVFRDKAIKRHNAHFGRIPAQWSREIGLSVVRQGVGTWYSPDDSLLKAMVFANVEGRMEFRKFLKVMHDRYHIIVGNTEAEKEKINADEKAFTENALRLERRLNMLGLLKRLSDDCAYVQNPFSKNVD